MGGRCPALWKHKKTETNVSQPSSTTLRPSTVLHMRVQIDLVRSPPQPNHLFSLKTDSFMCCYHVIMCCCSAGSYSISETFTSRQKGRMRRGVQGKRGAAAAVFYGAQNMPIAAPTFSLFCLSVFSVSMISMKKPRMKSPTRETHLSGDVNAWLTPLPVGLQA